MIDIVNKSYTLPLIILVYLLRGNIYLLSFTFEKKEKKEKKEKEKRKIWLLAVENSSNQFDLTIQKLANATFDRFDQPPTVLIGLRKD